LNTPTAAMPRPCVASVAWCRRALAGSAITGASIVKPCSRWQLVRKMGNLRAPPRQSPLGFGGRLARSPNALRRTPGMRGRSDTVLVWHSGSG